MLDQRDFTGKAALHHAVADVEERHQVVQTLLAAKAEVSHRPHNKTMFEQLILCHAPLVGGAIVPKQPPRR